MKRVRDLFEQCKHRRGRVADCRQHLGLAAGTNPRGFSGNGVALKDVRKQRTLGEKLARTPGVNCNPITGGKVPNHAQTPAQDQEYRRGRLTLPEQRLVTIKLTLRTMSE